MAAARKTAADSKKGLYELEAQVSRARAASEAKDMADKEAALAKQTLLQKAVEDEKEAMRVAEEAAERQQQMEAREAKLAEKKAEEEA